MKQNRRHRTPAIGTKKVNMTRIAPHILATIGNTPVVQIRKVAPRGCGRIVAKLESANPTGSMKDRMAVAMIEWAESDRRLRPDGRVVEFTGGSTGTSLAMVCAAKGYPLSLVTSNATSPDKRNHMKAMGASLTVLHSEGGKVTQELFQALRAATEEIVRTTGAFWTNQFNNADQVVGYEIMGRELWEQTEGGIDAFVHVVGTCGSLRGVAKVLREKNPKVKIVAVEPAESPVLSGGVRGGHRIEGVGLGYIPPLWQPGLADAIERVSTADAEAMARTLSLEEGIFVGTSSGANVVAAIRVAQQLGEKATVATILIDSGQKYLSTELFGEGKD